MQCRGSCSAPVRFSIDINTTEVMRKWHHIRSPFCSILSLFEILWLQTSPHQLELAEDCCTCSEIRVPRLLNSFEEKARQLPKNFHPHSNAVLKPRPLLCFAAPWVANSHPGWSGSLSAGRIRQVIHHGGITGFMWGPCFMVMLSDFPSCPPYVPDTPQTPPLPGASGTV